MSPGSARAEEEDVDGSAGVDAVPVGQHGQGVRDGEGAEHVGLLTARRPHPHPAVVTGLGDHPDEVEPTV
jgi:hypothetical protein